ncbi:MAG TPA: nuclear transport factor 2 family protein [Phnomibacter sp.]|nr:nuclear transport factor 2 family protein [Phnomibacter sp.]
MRLCIFAIILLAISTSTMAQNSPAERAVKAFSERKNQWLVKGQTDSLKAALDNRCYYIHSNGWVQTAKEVIDDLKSRKMVYSSITTSESTARQFEKMVIVTGRGRFEGTVEGKPFAMNLAFTEVYLNRAQGWKLVSRQSAKLE